MAERKIWHNEKFGALKKSTRGRTGNEQVENIDSDMESDTSLSNLFGYLIVNPLKSLLFLPSFCGEVLVLLTKFCIEPYFSPCNRTLHVLCLHVRTNLGCRPWWNTSSDIVTAITSLGNIFDITQTKMPVLIQVLTPKVHTNFAMPLRAIISRTICLESNPIYECVLQKT